MKRQKGPVVVIETMRKYPKDRRAWNLAYVVPGGFAFVRIALGTWMRVPVCVVYVACSYCDAAIGEPCKGKNGQPRTGRHYPRPKAMRDAIRAGALAIDQTVTVGGRVVRVPT